MFGKRFSVLYSTSCMNICGLCGDFNRVTFVLPTARLWEYFITVQSNELVHVTCFPQRTRGRRLVVMLLVSYSGG